jgi:ActR/RegA family two-component response regulator
MQNARILILDDDEQWITTFRTVLQGKVASIDSAYSLSEAINLIDKRYFNVAIVDLRLNNDDPSDDSGMEFLAAVQKRGLDDVMAPIMCTAFGNLTNAIEALRDFHVVDFINKGSFQAESLLMAVNKAIERQHRGIAVQIELEGDEPLAGVWVGKEWAQREDPDELAAELRDLLCRLFPRADHLWIRPLTAGQSGAGVLEVEPTYGAAAGEIDIVKFGKRDKIRREVENYAESVELFVSNQSTTRVESTHGRVMGAIRYRLIGGGNGRAESLAEYYRRHDVVDICAVLDNLFSVTCRRWYDNREQPRRFRNLVALYTEGLHIRWPKVWSAAARCGVDVTNPRLAFPGIAGEFTNPYYWLEERKYVCSQRVWLAITHGDLNEFNVLVSPDQHCWLIDFYRAGKGHILRDFVELETAFKLSLTSLESYAERVEFELLLLQQKNLKEDLVVDPSAAYSRAARVISHLRSLAGEVLGLEREMEEYHVALLLQTLKLLSLDYLHADQRSGGHVLLAAAMICSKLEKLG